MGGDRITGGQAGPLIGRGGRGVKRSGSCS
jgi:hypothetical protein